MAASLPAYDLIPLPGEGPEDVVLGSDGSIYTGLLDGRILAVGPKDGAVREVAKTGGRPLGLEATTDGRLLICDSPKGLLELDLKTGALTTLVTHDGAEPLIFCSNVVAAPDGDVFLTVSSMRYSFLDWRKDFAEPADRACIPARGERRVDEVDGRLALRQRSRADARR